MKIAFLADLHLSWENPVARTDDVPAVQLDKLEYVLKWCDEDSSNTILIIAGDMFDRPRSWYLLPKVIKLLMKYPEVTIYTIFGQHDTYLYSEITREATSLGVLEAAGLVVILGEKPTVDLLKTISQSTVLNLYGCHFGQDVPIPTTIAPVDMNVLVIHASIANKALFPGHEFTEAKKFLRKHKAFDLIICGDIHQQFSAGIDNRMIVNPGPMVRRSADLYNFKHKPSLGVYDTEMKKLIDSLILYEIPHKPAEEVLSREHIERPEENRAVLDEFIKGLKPQDRDPINKQGTFAENLQKYIAENDIPKNINQIIARTMETEKEG